MNNNEQGAGCEWRIFTMLLAAVLLPALLACSKSVSRPVSLPADDFPFSFDEAPFVHPLIVEDLAGGLSDCGDQVVSINLIDSQESNLYYGDVQHRDIEGRHPFVFV